MTVYRLILIISVATFLIGCGTKEVSPQSTSTAISTIVEKNITPTITSTIPTPVITGEVLVPTDSTTPVPVSIPSPSPTVDLGAKVELRCGEMTNQLEDIVYDLSEGIVIESELDSLDGIILLETDGPETPAFNWPLSKHGWKTSVSPDGLWLSYFESDFSTEPTAIEIFVINPATRQDITTIISYEGIDEIEGWLNNSQLFAFSTPVLSEDLSIVIWSPFTDQELLFSEKLIGFGDHDVTSEIANYLINPVIDPLLEYIIYPCYLSCQGNEYFVKELGADEITWGLDLEESLPKEWRGNPVWSPDGRYIALVGNGFYRNILIFDREGNEITEIQLPNPTRFGSASELFWSPDSQYLGFQRYSLDPNGKTKISLAYYDLESESIIDLCIDPFTNYLMHWSPDSSSIAYVSSPDPLADEEDRILEGYIIDINSGNYSKFFEAEGNEWDFLVGWAVPISSGDD